MSTTQQVILLVEDNLDDVELVRIAFQKNQLAARVVAARDGVEALEYLFGGDPAPSVVLLDLQLPRVNGLEVLRRIRENARTRLQPVVILTSSIEQEDVLQSYALGANSFVRKPIDFTQLVEAARQLCEYWLSVNHRPPPGVVLQ